MRKDYSICISRCQHHSRSSNKIDAFDSRRTNSKDPRCYCNNQLKYKGFTFNNQPVGYWRCRCKTKIKLELCIHHRYDDIPIIQRSPRNSIRRLSVRTFHSLSAIQSRRSSKAHMPILARCQTQGPDIPTQHK